jgi:hypothetical protein
MITIFSKMITGITFVAGYGNPNQYDYPSELVVQFSSVIEPSVNNTFYLNNFNIPHVRCKASFTTYGTAPYNIWDNGTVGNYWANYNGTDTNNDDIGDSPYIIDANNQDNYPLMAPINFAEPTDPTPTPSPTLTPATTPSPTPNITPTDSPTQPIIEPTSTPTLTIHIDPINYTTFYIIVGVITLAIITTASVSVYLKKIRKS